MTPARRFARLLLKLYPRSCRRAYGDDILRSLDDDLRDADSMRGTARHLARARAIADVARGGVLEWMRLRRASALRLLPPEAASPERPSAAGRLHALATDVRYAARALRASPGFTVASVATVAVSIGAATTIFSIVNGVLLKPLPYAESDRLVNIWNDLGRGAQSLPAVHPADFRDYQAWSTVFEEFGAASGGGVVQASGILTGGSSTAEQVDVSAVTSNFFPLLGVTPQLGRHFTLEEEQPGGPPVAMIAHGLWRRRFAGDLQIVGRSLEMDGRRYSIVGVLPREFRLHLPAEAFLVKDADVWLPLNIDYGRLRPRNWTYFTVFGRLRPEATLQQAQAEMDAIAGRLRREHAVHASSDLRIRVVSLHDDVVKRVRPALLMLQAAAGLVLLIGCVNVASLLFARARARARENATHAALGAGRARIAGRLLLDSALVAALGTVSGVAVTHVLLWAIVSAVPVDLPRLEAVEIDGMVLIAASLMCVATALASGVWPAYQASRRDPAADLKGAIGGVDSRGYDAVRRRLIVGEVALSLVLLTAAALLARSAVALHSVDPGFAADGVLTFRLALPETRYPGPLERRAFLERLQERLRRLPEVDLVGAVSQLPLTGSGSLSPYAFDEETARNWESVTADGRRASPEFFAAIGARLLAGRFFTEHDGVGRPPVIIIDDELARRVWPGQTAVGQRLQIAPSGNDETHAEVVGVIRHPRLHELARPVRPQIWQPLLAAVGRDLSFAIRTSRQPARLANDVRRTVAALDPELAVTAVTPLATLVAEAGASSRLNALLMLGFAVLSLMLAGVGVYGVVTYAVVQRHREFAVRLALGQDPAALQRMVLGQAGRLGTSAILLGVLGSLLAAGLLERFLYDTDSRDPGLLALASALLLLVVMLAAWLPARQAARTDPMVAFRADG